MNTAVVKFNKINSTENGFKGSVHTVQEDIVIFIATKATNKPLKKKRKEGHNLRKKTMKLILRRRNSPKDHNHGLNTSKMRTVINIK